MKDWYEALESSNLSIQRTSRFSLGAIRLLTTFDTEDLSPYKETLLDIADRCRRSTVDFQVSPVRSKEELSKALRRIEIEASAGLKPLVHIDCHGGEAGVQLAKGVAPLPWEKLGEALQRVNRASKNNLVVLLAACHGFRIIDAISPLEVSPFFGLFAPFERVGDEEVQSAVVPFYETLFIEGDADNAFEGLDSCLSHFGSEELFLMWFAYYLRTHRMGAARRKRQEALFEFARSRSRLILTRTERRERRRAIKKLVAPSRAEFEDAKNRVLMAAHPENKGRFESTFADALALARA